MNHTPRRWLITGGAGFIGSAMIRRLHLNPDNIVLNVDKLNYAANLNNLAGIERGQRYQFEQIDLCHFYAIQTAVTAFRPHIVMHFAAESHVDLSIKQAMPFVQSNIIGTFNLLEACRHYHATLSADEQRLFRFHHISTDEVFGDLSTDAPAFCEQSAYRPSSPYSATKASADHLVQAWQRTFGLPTLITHSSNNYGPYQSPDKLIPMTIYNALQGQGIPLYGDGQQIRDWLYVEDHIDALLQVATKAQAGETYTIGGHCEQNNLELVTRICEDLDRLPIPKPNNLHSYQQLIHFTTDRPGHDRRYAVDTRKIKQHFGWRPTTTLNDGLQQTIQWYLAHPNHWSDDAA